MAKETKKEKEKRIHVEILEKMISLVTTSLGLVAALAWNDAVKGLFSKVFPKPEGNILAMFLYAAILSIFVITLMLYLSRILKKAAKGNDKDKSEKEEKEEKKDKNK